MGKILYGVMKAEIELEDRVMAHLQAVVATKLRRGEGFFLNWRGDHARESGRGAAWIGPNVPLLFLFDDPKPIELRRDWLEAMTMDANSNGGLMLDDEPPAKEAAAAS